jgi:beta-glucosidase
MAEDADAAEMFQAFMKFLPLRALATFTPERFSEDMLNALIKKLNKPAAESQEMHSN